MLEIDGSQGEGGGQILRTSLALSMITGTPFRLYNIRARRSKPGLQRQHLTCVRAAGEVCGAGLRGAAVGSGDLTFDPGPVQPGSYRFAIGTAGSTSLVLQTVLPALLQRDAPSSVTLEGGTHNDHAPPFDFLEKAFVPLLNRMGADVALTLDRPGFYPVGGGQVRATIGVGRSLGRLSLKTRPAPIRIRARAVVSRLPVEIAERELRVVSKRLKSNRDDGAVVEERRSPGPGNVVLVEVVSAEVTEVFTGFGARGVPAERVASHAADEAKAYLDAEVPVGPHLADQLLLPMALGDGGNFLTQSLTDHTRTNADVIRLFLDVPIRFTEVNERQTLVEVK